MYKYEKKPPLAFVSIYLYRRLLYVLILLCLSDYPSIQIMLIIHMSLINLVLYIKIRPHRLPSNNIIVNVNEVLIYVCSVQMIAVSDLV